MPKKKILKSRKRPTGKKSTPKKRLKRKTVPKKKKQKPRSTAKKTRVTKKRKTLRKKVTKTRPERAKVKARPKTKSVKKKRGLASRAGKRVYMANSDYALFNELQSLVIKASPADFPTLRKKLATLKQVRLAIVTGVFLNIPNCRIDLLAVGDDIPIQRLTNIIKDIEIEMGKELRYVVLSEAEYVYRYKMYDRFLRDVMDYPHQRIISKIKV